MQGKAGFSIFYCKLWLGPEVYGQDGLSVRPRSTELQKDPDRLINKIIAYILQVQQQRNRHSYSHSDIIAMDDTAVQAKYAVQYYC